MVPDEAGAEWISSIPGTDTALMMAITHTLVVRGLHNSEFLARYTVGWPVFERYLRGEADGQPKDARWAAGITGVAADTITDFKHSQLDKIDLHLIDANEGAPGNQAFHLITGLAFTQAGQLRYDAVNHQLLGNTDGDTDAEFAINLTNVTHLVKGDFIL